MPRYLNTDNGTICIPELYRGWYNNFGDSRGISADVPVTNADCNVIPAAVLGHNVGDYYILFDVDTSQVSPSIVTPTRERICVIKDGADTFGLYACPLGELPQLGVNTAGTNINKLDLLYKDTSGRIQPRRLYWGAIDEGGTVDGTKVTQLTMWADPAELNVGTWTWDNPLHTSYVWIFDPQGAFPTHPCTIPWSDMEGGIVGGPKVQGVTFSVKDKSQFYTPLNVWIEGLVGVSASGGVPFDFYGSYSTSEDGTAYNYDWGNVNIGDPALPADGALACGLLTLYHPSDATLRTLAGYLTSDGFFDSLLKSWSDPMQSIIGLYLLPVSPASSTAGNLIFGGIDTGIATTVVTERYIKLNFGQVDIDERMRGFLDYGGNAKLSIHLPYAGFQDIPADMWMASSLGLTLSVDLMTGSGLYNLTCIRDNQLVRAEYPVNLASQVPLTSSNYMGAYSALLSAAASAAQGNLTGAAGAAIGEAVSTKVTGSAGTVPGSMGSMLAWITLEETDYALPAQYTAMMGWPLEISRKLGTLSGFTAASIDDQELSFVSDREREQLQQLLEGGVYL